MKTNLSYRFLLALALVLPASCSREGSQDEPQCHVEISTASGLLSEGTTLRPAVITVAVKTDLPLERIRVLLGDPSSDFSDEREVDEDGCARFPIEGDILLGSGNRPFTLRVVDTVSGVVLYQNRKVYVESEEVGAFFRDVAAQVKDGSGEVFDEASVLVLTEGDVGVISASLGYHDKTVSFAASCDLGKDVLFLTRPKVSVSDEDVSISTCFYSFKTGNGTISLRAEVDDKPIILDIPVEIRRKEPDGPGTQPIEEEEYFYISADAAPFVIAPADYCFSVRSSSDRKYDIRFLLDKEEVATGRPGKEERKASWDGLSVSSKVQFTLSSKTLAYGRHELTALFIDSESGLPAGESSVELHVYGFSVQWYAHPGNEKIDGYLLSSSRSKTFRMEVNFGAEIPYAVEAKDNTSGHALPSEGGQQGRTRSFTLDGARRGKHVVTVVVKDDRGNSASKETEYAFWEEYRCAYTVEGSNIYAELSGNSGSVPFGFDFSINGQLVGVIPYTEAIEYAGGHYDKEAYEYSYYDAFGMDFSFSAGDSFGRQKIWSGWINTAARHAQGKLKDLKVTHQASRWKKTGERYSKEYYTPEPYMQADIILGCQTPGISNAEYVVIQYEYSSIESFLQGYGIHLRVFRQ